MHDPITAYRPTMLFVIGSAFSKAIWIFFRACDQAGGGDSRMHTTILLPHMVAKEPALDTQLNVFKVSHSNPL
jgi:hypothetical protein